MFGLNNPWQDTNVSYFHHSIGGYHAVKLRRYQELIDYRLDGEYRNIIGALQKAQSIQDIMPVLAASPSLNMLNTRYIIYNPDQAPIRNPYAYGNAWFVDKVDIVENADAEIEALNTIDPLKTAVVDKRFAKDLEGFTPQVDSTATIVLEKYRPNRLTYKTKASFGTTGSFLRNLLSGLESYNRRKRSDSFPVPTGFYVECWYPRENIQSFLISIRILMCLPLMCLLIALF